MIPSVLRRLVRKPLSLVLVGVLVAIVAIGAVALTVRADLRTAVTAGIGGAQSGAALRPPPSQ